MYIFFISYVLSIYTDLSGLLAISWVCFTIEISNSFVNGMVITPWWHFKVIKCGNPVTTEGETGLMVRM